MKKILLISLLLILGYSVIAQTISFRSEISTMIYDSFNLREAEKCIALLDVYSEIIKHYPLANTEKAKRLSDDVKQVYTRIIHFKRRYYSEEQAIEQTGDSYSYFRTNVIVAITSFVTAHTVAGLLPHPKYLFAKPIDFHGETQTINERLTYCASHLKSKLGYTIGDF